MSTFTKAVETFKEAAKEWLSEEDSPALVSLEKAAAALDKEITPALLSSFNLTYRALLKRKPTDTTEGGDELDALIPDA